MQHEIIKNSIIMQRFLKTVAAIMLMVGMFFVAGCNKPDDPNNGGNNEGNDNEVIVTVITTTPNEITTTSAMCGAEVTVSEEVEISELGVCWSTQVNPTTNDAHLSTTIWKEPFTCALTDLNPNTDYHVRAYALRNQEYYYGADKSFITESDGGGNSGGGSDISGTYNGHNYVDLGLPSGLLWATCNVIANAPMPPAIRNSVCVLDVYNVDDETPENYGDYFAWGEIQPKTTYNWWSYQHCESSSDRLTKYTEYDGLTILLPQDDAATANWEGEWRIPTKEEWQELYENTTYIWIAQNDVKGGLFTASNGNTLFLPAAGSRVENGLSGVGVYGCYWTSSLYLDGQINAWFFTIDSNGHSDYSDDYYNMLYGSMHRYAGFSIRAVCPSRQNLP